MVQILESHGLMGGRLKIVRFSGRKNFYARVYNPKTRNSVTRSLKTTVLQVATDRAIEVWSELIPLIEAEIPTNAGSIEAAVESYLEAEQKRVDAGLVKPGVVRDKRAQLRALVLFCQLQDLRKVTDVKAHSLNGFMEWRRDESKKLTAGKAGVMELSSLNKSIREVRAFFKWLKHQHLVDVELELKEVISRHEKTRKKNVAFTERDLELIQQELKRWAFTEAKGPEWVVKKVRPVQWYGRKAFYYLFQLLLETGMRPLEAAEIVCWKDVTFRNEGKTKCARELDAAVSIEIYNPKGKGSRTCVSKAGYHLKKYRQYCLKFRHEHGYRSLKPTDPLFLYPNTEELYVYSHWGNTMRALLKRCGLQGKGYTIRSCRGTYVSQQLARGIPPYVVAKNCGHSVEVMRKAYEQISPAQLMEILCSE